MDLYYQTDKMTECIKRCISMIVLIHVCLNAETVFAVPSEIKQRTLSSKPFHSERERPTTSKTSQTIFLLELNKHPDTIGQSTNVESLSTEIVPDATVIPKTSIRHKKRKLRMDRKKDRNVAKGKKDKKSRRKRKIHRRLGLKQKSCPTQTSYVSIRTAEDIFGNTVDVYPVIHIGQLALDQYFYESFCDVERCSCAGVDNKKFKSSCQTTHSYTYAKVVKSGEIGWSYIKVRSGCSCVIQEKRKHSPRTITDFLL